MALNPSLRKSNCLSKYDWMMVPTGRRSRGGELSAFLADVVSTYNWIRDEKRYTARAATIRPARASMARMGGILLVATIHGIRVLCSIFCESGNNEEKVRKDSCGLCFALIVQLSDKAEESIYYWKAVSPSGLQTWWVMRLPG